MLCGCTTNAETGTEVETESETVPFVPYKTISRNKTKVNNTKKATISVAPRNSAGYLESDREKEIISYVQVTDEYYHDEAWMGDWSYIEAGNQQFMTFGCGICCMTNTYSTLTKDIVTPDIMYEWAKEKTSYNPGYGVGAISWSQLENLAEDLGFEVKLKSKPRKYSDFRDAVAESDTTIALVCKYNDDKLWFYTLGHYVNLWEYNPETDTVFVTDSSGLFNRNRVSLYDVYKALKTKSDAQFMTVYCKGTNEGEK